MGDQFLLGPVEDAQQRHPARLAGREPADRHLSWPRHGRDRDASALPTRRSTSRLSLKPNWRAASLLFRPPVPVSMTFWRRPSATSPILAAAASAVPARLKATSTPPSGSRLRWPKKPFTGCCFPRCASRQAPGELPGAHRLSGSGRTGRAIDLTLPPLDRDRALWERSTRPTTTPARDLPTLRGQTAPRRPLPLGARSGRPRQPYSALADRVSGGAAGALRNLAPLSARGRGAGGPGEAPPHDRDPFFGLDGGSARTATAAALIVKYRRCERAARVYCV